MLASKPRSLSLVRPTPSSHSGASFARAYGRPVSSSFSSFTSFSTRPEVGDSTSKPAPDLDSPESPAPQYAVYARRWWLLSLLSLTSMLQSLVWLTYGTIMPVAQALMGWSDYTFNIFSVWAALMYIVLTFFTPRILERFGLRTTLLLGAGLVCAATLLRALVLERGTASLVLAHLGSALNGLAGPLVLVTPSQLSAEWFAPDERTTSTTIGIMANYAGSGVAYLMALWVTTASDLRLTMYLQAGAGALVFALLVADTVLASAKPPLPPSPSATVVRAPDMLAGMRRLVRNRNFWILSLTFAAPLGVWSAWSSLLLPVLTPLHFTQTDAAWIGFVSIAATVLGSVIIAHFADRVRRVKRLLIVLLSIGAVAFTIFALLASRVVYADNSTAELAAIYLWVAIGSLAVNAANGLLYEAAVECCYPLDEVIPVSVMTIIFSLVGIVYSLLVKVVSSGVMNSLMAVFCGLFAVVMLFFREVRLRGRADGEYHTGEEEDEEAREGDDFSVGMGTIAPVGSKQSGYGYAPLTGGVDDAEASAATPGV